MLGLCQPAAACGIAGVLSFWLVGGPLVPFMALGISHRLGRRLLPSTELRVIAFLLSVPAAAIGIRLGFETLFVFDTLLFGPLVLAGTTLLASVPPLLLSLSPARRLMVCRAPLERVLLLLPVVFAAAVLTYYGLGSMALN